MTDTIWEGQSQTLTGAATGGRVIRGRYRLTHEFLYFETGTLRTDSQQVPIHAVMDVDVTQTMTQKARGVGNVVVHITRPGAEHERVVMDSISSPKDAQRVINDTARQAREALQTRNNTMHYNQGLPPQVAATATVDPIAQLRELGELRSAGVLSDSEFDSKKSEILSRM